MIMSWGASSRAVSVMNTLAASLGMAVTSTAARSMPASLRIDLLGRVAHQVKEPAGLHLRNPALLLLDDHERHLRAGQPFTDEGPDPAESGDDRMAAKRLDLPHHALVTQVFLELSLGEQREEPAQRERHARTAPGR